MVKIVNDELTGVVANKLVEDMKLNYDLTVQLHRCGMRDLSIAFGKVFMQLLGLFCSISEYIPDGTSEYDMWEIHEGVAGAEFYKKLLIDPTITIGLRNVSQPMNVEAIYQIMFDKDYRFIPLDQRPKDDFMNPPV